VNQPEPSWDEETKERWRSLFSATTLPAVIAHRGDAGPFRPWSDDPARRTPGRSPFAVLSPASSRVWAHYAEELLVEEGFRQDDPRFAHRSDGSRH